MAAIVTCADVSKSFRIPLVRRDTVREHAIDLFRRRPKETLRVLDGRPAPITVEDWHSNPAPASSDISHAVSELVGAAGGLACSS